MNDSSAPDPSATGQDRRASRQDGHVSPLEVDLCWTSRSSQQCLVDAGVSSDQPSQVHVEVGSPASAAAMSNARCRARGKNQVKVLGVYEQQVEKE